MQNKGFVKVFAVLLTLVCVFYLSFSVVTSYYMNKGEKYAAGDPEKLNQYLDSLSLEKVYGTYTFKQCREMEIGLGLDLKGGMNVILEISVADVVRSLSDNNTDPNFVAALTAAKEAQVNSGTDFMTLFLQEYKKLDPNVKLSAIFSNAQLKGKVSPNSTNDEVLTVLRKESGDAISNSFNVLRTRIDRFGVVAPNIQRLDKDGRILVELPGVKEPERVRKLLQGSANLEFWETYNLSEIYPQLANVNSLLAQLQKQEGDSAKIEVKAEETTASISETDSLLNSIDSLKAGEKQSAESVKEWQKQNPLFSKLNPNVDQSGNLGQGCVVGYANKRDTAEVNQLLALKPVRDLLGSKLNLKWGIKGIGDKEELFQLFALRAVSVSQGPALAGDVVTDAREDFDRTSNGAVVSMSMNAEGSRTWALLTKQNLQRSVAIVLDNYVYSAPTVQSEIPNGSSQISGNFTAEEAKDLANVLKSGKMAAKVNIVSEDIVGPSLGQEAVSSGLWSFAIALILLMTYMMSVYGVIPGLIANLGLVINLFFTMGILASFQAVLTLSGIAGLVLSLGVAVDANVLIYERAKEELRGGKDIKKSLSDAYKNAFSAIFDSNLTSIITGVVLFIFGTGPIKGFATTLIIGIIASFFTAVFITRIIFEAGFAKGHFLKMTFVTKLTKNVLTNTKINFIGQRKKGYILSATVITICIISFFVRGLNEGIDFSGGRNYIVRFDEPVKTQEINKMLEAQFGESSLSVITIGSENQVRVSTNYRIADESESVGQDIEKKLYDGLKPILGDKTQAEFVADNILSSQKVGPSVADDIKTGAIWAVLISVLAMGLYILFRFQDIAFSLGTIASVAHDTLIIIGFYSLFYGLLPFSMEIDQSFIAAILTVIGYSVNDTVVIFDRIREVVGLYPKHNKREVINDALNTTLARTFSTSLSTALVLICIFLLGGDTIRSFTFAMLFGIFLGTYSTLYIAVPIAYDWQMHRIHKKEKAALQKAK